LRKTDTYSKAFRVYDTAKVGDMIIDGLTMEGVAQNISFTEKSLKILVLVVLELGN